VSRRKKSTNSLGKDHPLEFDGLKAEDEVVYKRISDEKLSIGVIKYFHLGKTPCASVIDLQLGNYQTAIVEEIVREPSKKLLDSLWGKIASKSQGSRRSLRRGKTKKS